MAHACNLSYLGDDDHGSRPAQWKKLMRPYIKNKSGMMVHTCNPSYAGDIDRRIVVQGWPRQKVQDLIQKVTKAKKRLGVWLKWQSACPASEGP
jgi:hypothetical protein